MYIKVSKCSNSVQGRAVGSGAAGAARATPLFLGNLNSELKHSGEFEKSDYRNTADHDAC